MGMIPFVCLLCMLLRTVSIHPHDSHPGRRVGTNQPACHGVKDPGSQKWRIALSLEPFGACLPIGIMRLRGGSGQKNARYGKQGRSNPAMSDHGEGNPDDEFEDMDDEVITFSLVR
jgi:hypothetical protein